MTVRRVLLALITSFALTACGGGGAETTSQDDSSGSETAGSEATEAPAPEEPSATAVEPLGPDASEAAHDAEYSRSEIHRMEVELAAHLEAEEVDCEDATEAREGICEVADRICAMDQSDTDVAARCGAGNAECEEARTAVGGHCEG